MTSSTSRRFFAAAFLSAAASAASAQDADWTGAFVGLQLGGAQATGDIPETFLAGSGGVFGGADVQVGGETAEEEGAAGGLHLGYRREVGDYVLGVVGEVDVYDVSRAFGEVGGGFTTADGGSFEIERSSRVLFQLGAQYGRNLLYVQAGPAHMVGQARQNRIDGFGVAYGVGIERAVTDRVSVGLDYLRSDFGSVDALVPQFDGPSRTTDPQDVDVEIDQVRLRVSYRF